MKKGGETVYFGPTGKECSDMLDYFGSIGWVCPPKKNPADFILDVASATSLPADAEAGVVSLINLLFFINKVI